MTIPAQKFREIVFQLLYSYDIGRATDENMIDLLTKELSVTKKIICDAQRHLQLILKHKDEIDATIAKTSHAYAFERIQTVERNILRIGVYEILFDENIPPKVAIAEAMRLARKFSTKEAASFVNAILDAIYKRSIGKDADTTLLEESVDNLVKIEEISHDASQNMKIEQENPEEN